MTSILASIPSPPDNTLEIGPLEIHYYGILVAIGVGVAAVITTRRYVKWGGDGEFVQRVLLG